MGLFNKKKSVTRLELRNKLRRDRGIIRGGEGRYSYAQRDKMARETFGPKYGGEISKRDYDRAIRDLELKRGRADISQREKIDDKIKYLRQIEKH